MIVTKYETINGEPYVDAATYDKVLYELKAANEEKYRLTNKLKKVEAENNKNIKKIEILEKEFEEEKGKTFTVNENGILLKVDIWEMVSKQKELKDENKVLKQRIKDLEYAFKIVYKPESAESVMQKAGFSEEFIQDGIRINEAIEKDVRKQILKNENDVDKDKLLSQLQDQHQQDCIKINQLHVTIDTLVDKYSRLRKTVGMD